MTKDNPLFEFTATLPEDFYAESIIPFDSTHGLDSENSYQLGTLQSLQNLKPGFGDTKTQSKILQQLPLYHYSQHDEGPDEETKVSSTSSDKGWSHDFEKRGVLGMGGEGLVHLVHQHSLQREVAIKSLHGNKSSERGSQRLLDEAHVMGALEHPNVIPVYTLGRDLQDNPFLVMKKVEGDTWRELLRDETHQGWERLRFWSDDPLVRHLEILMLVCSALEHAHSRGILHRDIKPSNVMVGEFGEVYLIDWGLAFPNAEVVDGELFKEHILRLKEDPGRQHVLCGTPTYMAPEMFLCRPELIDTRADVYLLGATLFEIIYKRPPHMGKTLHEHMVSSLLGVHFGDFDETLQELVDVCKKATASEPSERFQDVASFRKAIAGFLRHRSSVMLLQQAKSSHRQLEDILSSSIQEDSPIPYGLFTEARFGYLQALQEWPENQEANDGYQRCLEQMLLFHVEHKRLSDAEALFIQLMEERPDLSRKIEELREELKAAEEQRAYVKRFHYEMDSSLSHKERILYVLAIGIPTPILTLVMFLKGKTTSSFTNASLLSLALVVFALYLLFMLFGRKLWTRNTFDRRFFYLLGIYIGAVCFHRWLGYMNGQDPNEIMLVDLAIFAIVGFTGSLFFKPLLVPGILSCAFTLVAVWNLSWVREIMNIYSMTVCCFLFALYKNDRFAASYTELKSLES